MIEELCFRQLRKDEGKYQRQGGNVNSVGNEDGPVPGCSPRDGEVGPKSTCRYEAQSWNQRGKLIWRGERHVCPVLQRRA